MGKTTHILATALLALLAVPGIVGSSAHADIVLMKDGRLMEGEVVEGDMDSDAIIFRANMDGTWTTMTLKTEEVDQLSMEYGDQSDKGNPATPSTPARSPGTPGAGSSPSSPATSLPEGGLQQVRATGEGRTMVMAIEEACRDAVTQVTGALIIGETTVENGRLINDKIVAFSNGIVEEFEVIDKSKVGTGSDAWWKIVIDAKVLVTRVIEILQENNITIRAEIDTAALSLLGKKISEEERDQAAAETLDELMQYYPQCIWTIEPVGELRTQANRTSGGEIIAAHKVRFELDQGKWRRFAKSLKSLLGEICLEKETVRLFSTNSTLANTYDELKKINYGFEYLKENLAELSKPIEERVRLGQTNHMGRVSIETSSKVLGTWTPRDQRGYRIGDHDTVVVLDHALQNAVVYAVPSEAWDRIGKVYWDVPEVYFSIIDGTGLQIGRALFNQDDCFLVGDGKWESKVRILPQGFGLYHEAPRCLVFSPRLALSSTQSLHTRRHSWLGTSVDIEYPFALTEEDMVTDDLALQVEIVGAISPSPSSGRRSGGTELYRINRREREREDLQREGSQRRGNRRSP